MVRSSEFEAFATLFNHLIFSAMSNQVIPGMTEPVNFETEQSRPGINSKFRLSRESNSENWNWTWLIDP